MSTASAAPRVDSQTWDDRTMQTSAAQPGWAATPVRGRLRILRTLRHLLAKHSAEIASSVSSDLSRTRADTLAAELLPLLAACKFLEREAANILAPRKLGRRGLPFWLASIHATVERVPLGTILIIAPSNYPLFLPGVQAMQALAAGNAVVWKPGRNSRAIADLFASLSSQAGLPHGLIRVTDESVATAATEIAALPAKIVFTGSAAAGRAVQHLAADHNIPVIAELSGCDAVFVLPSAETARVADALCFGMRLNGSATCMAPRRLILVGGNHEALLTILQQRFAAMDPVFLPTGTRDQLRKLLADARAEGGLVDGEPNDLATRPILIRNGTPLMQIAQTDLFAPVLTVISVENTTAAITLEDQSPFGLTAAIFGDESEARRLAQRLTVGTILINDLIVPTADPRIPFGGRKASGFGTTRGAEGLLEMTAPRTITTRRNRDRKHFQPTTVEHEALFTGVIAASHQSGWRDKLVGLKQIVAAAKKLK